LTLGGNSFRVSGLGVRLRDGIAVRVASPELSIGHVEMLPLRYTLLTALILATLIAGRASAQESPFDPTSVYKRESILGFTILINPEVLSHRHDAAEMRKELRSQLTAIVREVPAKVLPGMRKVWIWVEWGKQKNGAAVFHPSAGWLKENGYNPAKAGHIELSNTRNFVQWSRSAQPWMVLHELAHSYHHLALGDDCKSIEAAYKHAVDTKLYESVAYCGGGKQRAYALTNSKEYFAELSESYFGKNDFYPFVRSELKTYDPQGFQLMEQIWGKSRSK
jgi:hypothetical protein